MAVTDFKSAVEDARNKSVLSTDYHAEEGEYLPAAGSARTINAKVFLIQLETIGDDGNENQKEQIAILVSTSSTTGIDKPQIGDRYRRPAARDPGQRPYQYTGEIAWKDPCATHHRLVFQRDRDTARAAAE